MLNPDLLFTENTLLYFGFPLTKRKRKKQNRSYPKDQEMANKSKKVFEVTEKYYSDFFMHCIKLKIAPWKATQLLWCKTCIKSNLNISPVKCVRNFVGLLFAK